MIILLMNLCFAEEELYCVPNTCCVQNGDCCITSDPVEQAALILFPLIITVLASFALKKNLTLRAAEKSQSIKEASKKALKYAALVGVATTLATMLAVNRCLIPNGFAVAPVKDTAEQVVQKEEKIQEVPNIPLKEKTQEAPNIPLEESNIETSPPLKNPCDLANAITKVKLLTNNFSVSGEPQTLRYHLTISGCPDGEKVVNVQIAYDFALTLPDEVFYGDHPVSYKVKDTQSKKVLAKGDFQEKRGVDIYGPRDDPYFIWITDSFSFGPDSLSVILEVSIGAFTILQLDEDKAKNYLRVGLSKPAMTEMDIIDGY